MLVCFFNVSVFSICWFLCCLFFLCVFISAGVCVCVFGCKVDAAEVTAAGHCREGANTQATHVRTLMYTHTYTLFTQTNCRVINTTIMDIDTILEITCCGSNTHTCTQSVFELSCKLSLLQVLLLDRVHGRERAGQQVRERQHKWKGWGVQRERGEN